MTRKYESSKLPDLPDRTWITLREASPLFGMSYEGIKNLITKHEFPVPTYRIGRTRVIDKKVLDTFFEEMARKGIEQLKETPPDVKARYVRRP